MRFIGYLRSQRAGMLGLKRHTNRPELIEKYGFDAKYAMHMVRLGVQGVELLETGKITLPIPEPWLTWLRDLRQGKHTKQEALAAADELEAELEKLITSSPLPERPDRDRANAWLQQAYQRVWGNPITR
ncbi:Predicted nucleotidyltransferase [Kibdelosporangium aridum]|uniref:Predicted nucleotidyltransferase n=2 Tax=Kibdelosporangium aridum TaxID=2030 RepID=A0A1Y5XZF3_KIBAR|nr:Predicted nucleotidyltransferase [Kibdelosporangium aridum]